MIHLPIRPYPAQVSWRTKDDPHHHNHSSSSSSSSSFMVQNQSLQFNVARARTIFDTIWQQYIRFDDDHENSDNDDDIEVMVLTTHPSNHTVTTALSDHSLVVIADHPTESPAQHHRVCSVDVDATGATTTAIDAAVEPKPTSPSTVLIDATTTRRNDVTISNSSSPLLLSTHIRTTGIADHMVHRDRQGNNHDIPRNMAVSQRQNRMISIEQMMEQEMKDIHTILIAMCLVTITILIVMVYYMQNEQPSDSRPSCKNANSRSKKSTVHSHTTNHHHEATFLHRTLSYKRPPAAAAEIQNDYMVMVSTTPATDRDGKMSPLSTDTVAQRSELYRRSGGGSWEEPTRTHVPPVTSSHETMTPTLSPCSEWWQNRRRRTLRHHHPSAGISNLGPPREPQRDGHFITPICNDRPILSNGHFITPICDDRPILSNDDHHLFDMAPEMTAAFTAATTVPNLRDIPDDPHWTTRRIVPDATPTLPHPVTPTTAPLTERGDRVTTTPVLQFSDNEPSDHCSFVNDYW